MTRRAFALPLVVLLSLVVGVLAAAMLERLSAQRLIVQRQLALYHQHHLGRGVREVLSAWFNTLRGENINELFTRGTQALELTLEDGNSFKVYIADGQGALLASPAGLASGQNAADALGCLNALLSSGRARPEMLRTVGPLTVSIQSAPPEVLQAVLDYATDGSAPEDKIAVLVEARAERTLTDADLNTALAGLDEDAMQIAKRILTARPELLRLTVGLYGRDPFTRREQLVEKYNAFYLLSKDRAGAKDGSLNLEPLSNFLSWEEVPPE